eukprot:gnl/MRDRNA2_/MRDRNA2_107740_c0_seq1.p1 gnl/MRDRNA2_/MRDRNA2_107740_c0~~gnl/MRDRNA2_/MRDRNA2_107740_c0_seq1.p1  ORF type:complete len:387 (+),score=82.33 gnl/MRDRNA2_/MRDRNA2_107740_c0_seq1:184-1344(+)
MWRFAVGTVTASAAVKLPQDQRTTQFQRPSVVACAGANNSKSKAGSTRILGSGTAALHTSALGFGCMGITAFYGTPMADDDAVQLMKHAFDEGVTHFDTAEVYTSKSEEGQTIYNETVVGKAIQVMGRENVQIATKYMPKIHGDEMTSAMVLAACQASCKRLQVDSVDLYYVHRFHDKVPVEEQAFAMKAVVDAGLARHIGVSEFSPENLRRFHAICPVTCVQQEWSLMNRDLEEDLVPTCRELGIGIVAYSPLSRALLTGELKSASDLKSGDLRASRYPRLSAENIPKNAAIAERIRAHADKRNVTPAQLALAWVSNQGEDVVPIPGTTRIKNLDDNIKSCNLTLDSRDLKDIAAAVPLEQVSGDRYHGGNGAMTYKAVEQKSKL